MQESLRLAVSKGLGAHSHLAHSHLASRSCSSGHLLIDDAAEVTRAAPLTVGRRHGAIPPAPVPVLLCEAGLQRDRVKCLLGHIAKPPGSRGGSHLADVVQACSQEPTVVSDSESSRISKLHIAHSAKPHRPGWCSSYSSCWPPFAGRMLGKL